MKKVLVVIGLAAIFAVAIPAQAGSPSAVETTLSQAPELQPTLDQYLLKLKELEDLEIPAKQFRVKQKEIVTSFVAERTKAYQQRKLVQSVSCEARAAKPDPFRGRNSDNCVAALPTAEYRGKWLYDSHTTTELHRLEGGSANYNVAPSAGNHTVTLSVACTSPYWQDTASGHCDLNMKMSATFEMSDAEIARAVNAEALNLMQ